MAAKRFQNSITTMGGTLPIVLFLFAAAYIFVYLLKPLPPINNPYPFWQAISGFLSNELTGRIINFLQFGIIGYVLIGLNTAYGFIRVRTTFQTSIYFLLIASSPFLYPFQAGSIAGLCFFLAICFLLWSNQQKEPTFLIFQTMFFIALGSLAFPQLLYFVPFLFIAMISLQVFTLRTFFAGVVGIATPYWFLAGHAFFYDQIDMFYTPFLELVRFEAIDYRVLSLPEGVSIGLCVLLLFISSIHHFIYSYQDNIRTRIFLNFLISLGISVIVFMALQPQHASSLLQLLLPITAVLSGHFFVLTNSRISNLLFITVLLILVALTGINIWML